MKKIPWTQRIAKARKTAGLTQQALADALGVHYVTMSKIENAKAGMTVDQAMKLADILNISAYDLLGSGPYSNVLNLKGFIYHAGIIKPNEKKVELTVVSFIDPFSSEEYEWFEIRTSEFYPMVHEGDRVRTSVLPDEDADLYLDRLCVFEEINDASKRSLALMGYGRSSTELIPKAMNGRVIATEGMKATRWVSLIMPSPKEEKEIHVSS